MKWFLGVISLLMVTVAPAYALEGVGARADRLVGNGSSYSLLGKTAPWAEVVVVDENNGDQVMAVAEIESGGDFKFSFRLLMGNEGSVVVFAVDEVGITSRVPLSDFVGALPQVLMPPTIVRDDGDTGQTNIALTGFAYPGSDIDIHIYSSSGYDEFYKTKADLDGQWWLNNDDLPAGKYTAVAKAYFDGLESRLSQEIYFEIGGEGLIEEVTSVVGLPGQLVTSLIDIFDQIVQTPAEVAKLIVPAAATALVIPVLLRDGLTLLWRLMVVISNLFIWGKKRKSWGVVYDSVTKRPLARAIVRLFSTQGNKLLETDVTGERGVFSFLPRPGEYFLTVVRSGFNFPSLLIRGTGSDGEYSHLYHGEVVKVGEDEAVVLSLPMDPLEYEPTLWFYVKRWTGIVWNIVSWVLLGVGLVSSALALWRQTGWLNVVLLASQIAILVVIIWEVRRKIAGWSVVKDGTGKPVSGVTVSLYDVEFNRMVKRRVTDDRGRFQMVVPAGKYKLEVESEGYIVDLQRKGGFDGGLIEVGGRRDKAIKVRVYLMEI